MLKTSVMASTIIPNHKGFLYQTLEESFCFGVRLYTSPTSSSSFLGCVKKTYQNGSAKTHDEGNPRDVKSLAGAGVKFVDVRDPGAFAFGQCQPMRECRSQRTCQQTPERSVACCSFPKHTQKKSGEEWASRP